MWNESLHLTDVAEIFLLCALIFIPLGIYIERHLKQIRRLIKADTISKCNLNDEGSLKRFLEGSANNHEEQDR